MLGVANAFILNGRERRPRTPRNALRPVTVTNHLERVEEAANWLRAKVSAVPGIGVVLGSGLGAFADTLAVESSFHYQAIPHWPLSRVVKVDDAEVGIAEGKAAGVLTVGVAASGNFVGLSLEALNALPTPERAECIEAARQQLRAAGADLVIDSVAHLICALEHHITT